MRLYTISDMEEDSYSSALRKLSREDDEDNKRRRVDLDRGDNLKADLEGLLMENTFSDISFCFEDGDFVKAHRAILCARSHYFNNLFHSGLRESSEDKMQINDCSKPAFVLVLRYLYTENLQIEKETSLTELAEAYRLADRYLIKKLPALLEQRLLDGLSLETAADLLRASQGLDSLNRKLQEKVPELLGDNLDMSRLLSLQLDTYREDCLQAVRDSLNTYILQKLDPSNAASVIRSLKSRAGNEDMLIRVKEEILKMDLLKIGQDDENLRILQVEAPDLLVCICKALSYAGSPPDHTWSAAGLATGEAQNSAWRVNRTGLIANLATPNPSGEKIGRVGEILRNGVVGKSDEFSIRVVSMQPGHVLTLAIQDFQEHGSPRAVCGYNSRGSIFGATVMDGNSSSSPCSRNERVFEEGSIVTLRVDGRSIAVWKGSNLLAAGTLPESGRFFFAVHATGLATVELVRCPLAAKTAPVPQAINATPGRDAVLELLSVQSVFNPNGVSLANLQYHFPASTGSALRSKLKHLIAMGDIYTTVDEDTFLATVGQFPHALMSRQ